MKKSRIPHPDALAYSKADVAALLSVSHSLVCNLIRDKALGHIKVGRRVLIARAEVERFLAAARAAKSANV